MKKWDEKEKRNSNREELNSKIGKFMVISALVVLSFYLAIYY